MKSISKMATIVCRVSLYLSSTFRTRTAMTAPTTSTIAFGTAITAYHSSCKTQLCHCTEASERAHIHLRATAVKVGEFLRRISDEHRLRRIGKDPRDDDDRVQKQQRSDHAAQREFAHMLHPQLASVENAMNLPR